MQVIKPEKVITTISNLKTGEKYNTDEEWKAKGVPESDIRRDVKVIMPSLDLFPKTKQCGKMAITRSQIARQLLAEGGVSLDDAKMMAPEGEFLAYINPKEANMLKQAGGSGIMTPMGIPSFVEYGTDDPGTMSQASASQDQVDSFSGGDNAPDAVTVGQPPQKTPVRDIVTSGLDTIARFTIPGYGRVRSAMDISNFISRNTQPKVTNLVDEVALTGGRTPTVTPEGDSDTQIAQPVMPMMPLVPKLPSDIEAEQSDIAKFTQRFSLPERSRLADGGDVSVKDAERMALPGESLAYINDDEAALLKSLGGAGKAVNETGIPSFFVKKLFKKATKAVKKVVKSPIGKAALAGAAIYGLGGGAAFGGKGFSLGKIPGASFFGKGSFNPLKTLVSSEGFSGLGPSKFAQFLGTGPGKAALGITGASVLGGLAAGGEEEEDIDSLAGRISDQTGIDVQQIRKEVQDAYAAGDISGLKSKYPFLVPTSSAMAEGGIARLGYADGGLDKIREAEKYATQKQTEFLKSVDIDNIPRTGNLQREQERAYENAYKEYMERNTKAEGGIARLGYANGETVLDISNVNLDSKMKAAQKLSKETGMPIEKALEKIMADAFAEGVSIKRIKEEMVMPKRKPPKEVQKRKEQNFEKAKPGLEKESADMVEDLIRSKKAGGGLMDLGGTEMDLRGGGFVPIGAKEKADDVPARLSKNEFVFTADAVRAAGGGSVEKGAQKMYNTMKQLEDNIA